jgi:hypothetical protein
MAFLVAPDKINPGQRLFLPLKSNISRACPGLAFRLESHALPSGIETSRVAWEAKPVTITASEALSSSTPKGIDDPMDIVAACIRVFDADNVTELRASRLLERLKEHEGLRIDFKKLKHGLAECGIGQEVRSDANYYLKADFVAASSSCASNPPSLHPAFTFQPPPNSQV